MMHIDCMKNILDVHASTVISQNPLGMGSRTTLHSKILECSKSVYEMV